ncbi:putative autotransporter adhesin-like protein [Winogradskyella wandonensis]|uniref:Putative autotransporter adhesin-like protein n=1 Tax=Winogradskyella wandonensis TaxID=1442586 RepID=A0A4R1KQE4_9FLAO|nr:head GIN domain-containing protein [Winogradskyella wandonensis]TCK66680.1 putative autotransporter adhesin-like protein [Winogradskyella wandonensis]
MSTLARIIAASILALLMTSCNFDINIGPGVHGDGNVTTEKRDFESEINNLKVSRGIEVILIQNNVESLEVQADENLLDVITTEFDEDNSTLRISANENIKSASSKMVILNVKDLSSISCTSGAIISTEDLFQTGQLTISSTSGSQMDVEFDTDNLKINSTSGAGIKISGTTECLNISATSGSYIKAENLRAKTTSVSATSGASISVNTSKELTAKATSGGSIKYSGNPEKVNKSDGVSGSIREN